MNRLHLSLLSLVASAGSVALLASPAAAQESSRRTSLAGSPLIEDSDDIYAFPQNAFGHKLYLEANFKPSSGLYGASGSGGIIFGNETAAFGIFTHRADFNSKLSSTLMGPFEPYGAQPALRTGLLRPPVPEGLPGEKPTEVPDEFVPGGSGVLVDGTVVNAGNGPARPELAASPVQLIDLIYARENFGLRLSVGTASNSEKTQLSWGDGAEVTSNAFLMNVVAGYTAGLGGGKLETAAELGFARAHTDTLDVAEGLIGNDQTSTVLPALGLGARLTSPSTDTLDYVFTGSLNWESESTSTNTNDVRYYWDNPNTPATDEPEKDAREEDKLGPEPKLLNENSTSNFALYVGGGPRYEIAKRATVAADIGIGFSRTASDPWVDSACTDDTDDKDVCEGVNAEYFGEDNTIEWKWMLPSVRVAGEFNVSKHVTLRSGLRHAFTVSTRTIEGNAATNPADPSDFEDDQAPDVDDRTSTQTGQTYYWSAGIGLNFGELTIDGTFDTSFVNNGPNFLSGAGGAPMFGLLSVKYDFGTGTSNDTVTGVRDGYEKAESDN